MVWSLLIGFFRSRASLEAENLALRQQIIVLRRTAPKRLRFNALDRLIFVGLHRLFPDIRHALAVVRPETVIRLPWHFKEEFLARGAEFRAGGGKLIFPLPTFEVY